MDAVHSDNAVPLQGITERFLDITLAISHTPRKFNIAPENGPSQKETIVFQPPRFSGAFAVKFRRCSVMDFFFWVGKNCEKKQV